MNMYSYRHLKIFAFILLLLVRFSSDSISQTVDKQIDDLFIEWDTKDTPGVALGIIKEGKLVYTKGYGMADLEHDIPNSPISVFYIASVSKQFVTMSILLLEEQGKVNLDDEIQVYLPDFPRYESPLTIRHFIHHTSGVRDYLTLWSLLGKSYLDRVDKDAVYRLIKPQKTLNFTPGEKYLYSNSCYFMLAMVVEKASGQSIQEFARKNIFEPLDMNDSHFHDNNLHIIKNRAFSYTPSEEGYDNLIMRFDLVGSGGVYSTINDLYKWDQNFDHNILGKGGPRIINKMHEDGVLNNGESANYAFALHNDTYRGLRTVGHGGSLAGYRTQFMRFPDQNFSVILLANSSSFKSSTMAKSVADIYLEEFMEPLAKEAEKKESSSNEGKKIFKADNIGQYAGTYYSEELDIQYKFTNVNGVLLITLGDGDPIRLKATKADTYSYAYIEIVFNRKGNNAISGLIINAGRVQNLAFSKSQ